MKLKNTRTGEYVDADIDAVNEGDFKRVGSGGQFEFDWQIERGNRHDVYKIYLRDSTQEILGLLSLKDFKSEHRIHINLLEVSAPNIGKGKVYERIAGCLLAFACQLAFEKPYDGFVSLIPKTNLINHYCQKYGFRQIGRNLAVEGEHSLAIIQNYM
jgi:hypothetical protein